MTTFTQKVTLCLYPCAVGSQFYNKKNVCARMRQYNNDMLYAGSLGMFRSNSFSYIP